MNFYFFLCIFPHQNINLGRVMSELQQCERFPQISPLKKTINGTPTIQLISTNLTQAHLRGLCIKASKGGQIT